MKLFQVPDNTIDRKDRAPFLTPIFDLAFSGLSAGRLIHLAGSYDPVVELTGTVENRILLTGSYDG